MHLYPKWWRRNFLQAEFFLWLVATVWFIGWWKWFRGDTVLGSLVRNNRAQIYGTLASLFGSLLGFVITALSVVLGFSASERLKIVRSSAYYKQLWEVFTSAIRVLGITTVLWLVALFFDREPVQRPLLLLSCLSLSILSALRLMRCVWVLERIVEVLTGQPEADQQPR